MATTISSTATQTIIGAGSNNTALVIDQSNGIQVAGLNGGQLGGFRNKIINGDMRISQRGAIALSSNNITWGGADRWLTWANGAVSSGSSVISALTGASSNFGQWVTAVTSASIKIYHGQRIESLNTVDMNGKVCTVSGKIYQDTGGTVNYTVTVDGATVKDNFTALNNISSNTINIPSGVLTPFSFTFTVGATGASNGVAVGINTTSALACTSNNFAIADIQLELGSVATPFEQRPYGLELALCQRYYEVLDTGVMGYAAVASAYLGNWSTYAVRKRVLPTVTLLNTGELVNVNALGYASMISAIRPFTTSLAAGQAYSSVTIALSAEL